MKRTSWMSQAAAETLAFDKSVAIISITEPGERANINTTYEETGQLLRLAFADADEQSGLSLTLFDETMAETVYRFVDSLPETVELVIVHCQAGISRSAAVAIALSEVYELRGPDADRHARYNLYNKLVYRIMHTVGCKLKHDA